MNTHPRPEEWVPYFYGEVDASVRRELRAHLEQCPECRTQLKQWQSTRRRLSAWRLPRPRSGGVFFVPALRLAAAAVIVLLAGFAVGRLSTPVPRPEKLRAAIEPQIRQALRQELAQLAREQIEKAAEDTLVTAGQQADGVAGAYAQEVYLLLKKDIDTLALNADAGLRQTAEQIVQLSDSRAIPQDSEQQ
jgi:anti-sigma factor RsiW